MPFNITSTRTLGECVNEVAQEVGFAVSIADAAGSTDAAVIQMVRAVNRAAIELLGEGDWPDFIETSSLTVAAAAPGDTTVALNLPADFYAFVNRTQNDATALLPTRRPLNAEQWQSIATISPYVSFNLLWQYRKGQLWFLNPPAPGAGHNFTFQYLSQAIVKDADDPLLLKNVATKNGDTILLDSDLVIALAVVLWRGMKGFDTTSAERNYQKLFGRRFKRQEAAKIVTIGDSGIGLFNPISINNLPETGFGS